MTQSGKFICHKCKIKIHSDTESLVVNSNYQGMIFTFFILDADHNQASSTVEAVNKLFAIYLTIGSCFSVHYRVMEHAGSLESTKEE